MVLLLKLPPQQRGPYLWLRDTQALKKLRMLDWKLNDLHMRFQCLPVSSLPFDTPAAAVAGMHCANCCCRVSATRELADVGLSISAPALSWLLNNDMFCCLT